MNNCNSKVTLAGPYLNQNKGVFKKTSIEKVPPAAVKQVLFVLKISFNQSYLFIYLFLFKDAKTNFHAMPVLSAKVLTTTYGISPTKMCHSQLKSTIK